MLALLLLPVAALSSPGESRLARPGRTVAEIEAQLRRAFDVAFRQPRTLSVRTVVDRTGSREPGTFEMIDVSLTGGRIDMLPVDTALLRFHRVQLDLDALFDQGNLVLLSRSPVDLRLVVTEAGLNEVLSLKHQNLAVEEPHLSIKNGKVHFAGRIRKFLNSRV
ncbi:MAG: hypothetical protein HY815_24025, partial [Candidatus Riflebacteria bacterium]|nr:hypothetical protein [Candidatus Riflebacteria bacterium]